MVRAESSAVRPSVCRPSAVRRPHTRYVESAEYQLVETVELKIVDREQGFPSCPVVQGLKTPTKVTSYGIPLFTAIYLLFHCSLQGTNRSFSAEHNELVGVADLTGRFRSTWGTNGAII